MQVTGRQALQLQVQSGPEAGRIYRLETNVLTLGRQSNNNIVLRDAKASRLNTRLELGLAGLIAIDNGSANGTFINGVRISAPQLLRPNDTIQIGQTILLLMEVAAPRPQPAMPAMPLQQPQPYRPPQPLPVSQPRPPMPSVQPQPYQSPQRPPMPMPPMAPPYQPPQRPPFPAQPPQYIPVQVPPLPVAAPPVPLKPKKGTSLPVINREPLKAAKDGPSFPNFMQVSRILPIWFWHVLRVISVSCAIATGLILFILPEVGLTIFWKFFVPSLPILFFVAPGLWRNICPMAALNQTPRLFKFTRALTIPKWFKEYSYVIGIGLFLVIVPTRKVIFNQNGIALGIVVFASLLTAFAMGSLFKGKSGWCSSMCPLLPVQRIYAQTPFVKIPNSHCQPCVGCTKNCYDFNPQVAYLADLNDDDPRYANYRKFFVGLFPGLILGFYGVADPQTLGDVPAMYFQILTYMCLSLGLFMLLTTFSHVSAHKITTLFAAAALNIYYWYNIPTLTNAIAALFGQGQTAPDWLIWTLKGLLLALTLAWIVRTYVKESLFLAQATKSPAGSGVKVGSTKALEEHGAATSGEPEINFINEGKRCVVAAETTILDVAESNDLHIEAGCRMGMCGADPIAILKGMGNLSPISEEEQATLDRLGKASNTRMACCARVRGPVEVALKPEEPSETPSSLIKFDYDPAIKSIVIIGNGVAGATAADHIRRRHPEVEIHLIGQEKHHLYNRMGISRLVYGRSAMQGLYLLPETWYDEHKITTWLNTQVYRVDHNSHQVFLAIGETLHYDKLVLAMGSRSTVPPIESFGIPGTFVLREAEDAMHIRAFTQDYACKRAIVAGGGLLGLEAAYALLKLGLSVSVLERSERLLSRQLDRRASELLTEYLENIGIRVVKKAESAAVQGVSDMSRLPERVPLRVQQGGSGQTTDHVTHVILKDGRRLSCDIFLVAAGITPNIELAKQIGVRINKGVVIDDMMRTSLPDVLAAGDVAEFEGQIHGLWPVATEQAQAVAINAVGGQQHFKAAIPVTALKVVGVELTSVGQFDPKGPEDYVIALEDTQARHYRKLVINQGRVVGAILLGYPLLTSAVSTAIKKGYDVRPYIPQLQAGNWEILGKLAG